MIYNFPDGTRQDEQLEEGLRQLRQAYQGQKMPERQVERLKARMKEADMGDKQGRKRARAMKYTAAAALIGVFLALPNTSATAAYAMGQIPVIGHLVKAVTFRDYTYESDRNYADIKAPGLELGGQAENPDAAEALEDTTKEVNAEIQQITDKLVKEFKESLDEEGGHQDVIVNSEVLASNGDYFTLKLNCYQGAGSGYEWNYYYTIDLNTGERLKLSSIFQEGVDYITPISENIKTQMRRQMSEDENVIYWLENDIEEWNFKSITDDTSFYLDEDGQVVIGFDEGEVAPMYMGAVEFKIPADVLKGIRKTG
ncbi:MAG: RsiV family protein [Ruminococcus flavefaciens]|nr:RsiV family protein [Ruminococcus flavefaciens]